jgi:predicted AAA+ superfamily ATPase
MKPALFHRLLKPPTRSFFLFGPRGAGKSTWLKRVFPKAVHLDLLDASLALELTRDPHRLEALLAGKGTVGWVILDEIQKIPSLLEEVHRLMETKPWRFALCGSSARKLKRGGADLLAGRALTATMGSFSYSELGDRFSLSSALAFGTLPLVTNALKDAPAILHAYVTTYIKEEIKEEGILRQVPPFLRFLLVAGIMNGQMVNASNIAAQAGVARASVDNYFSILEDTLLGHFLPTYQPGLKVRERAHPKFYWFDPGVARAAAGLLFEPVAPTWKGWALETLIFHELRVRNEVTGTHRPLAYYRTAAGVEIDFIIELKKRQMETPAEIIGLEVKLSSRWDRKWNRALEDMRKQKGIRIRRLIGIYTGHHRYKFGNVEVYPVEDFLTELHNGNIF